MGNNKNHIFKRNKQSSAQKLVWRNRLTKSSVLNQDGPGVSQVSNTFTPILYPSAPTQCSIVDDVQSVMKPNPSFDGQKTIEKQLDSQLLNPSCNPNLDPTSFSDEEYTIIEKQVDTQKDPICNPILVPTDSQDNKCEEIQQIKISGNRIVNLQYVLDWSLNLQINHLHCGGKFVLIAEDRRNLGLISKLIFKCPKCFEIQHFTTDNVNKSTINIGYVWGTDSAGSTFTPSQEVISCMDIPAMNFKFYKTIEKNLFKNSWQQFSLISMGRAAEMEKERARELGNVDGDGLPFITVHADGSWSKRSYGHSYNASSGVAVIIGAYTNKVVFMGVRNKNCKQCKEANKPHLCVRNWNGSSTSMETDIIVEGFSKSETMYGLRYKYLIGDGDASVFNAIRNSGRVPYGHLVAKIECSNHAVKNVGKRLLTAKANSKSKIISNNLTINNIKHVQKFLLARLKQYENGSTSELAAAFENAPRHVFGDHRKCQNSYCENFGNIFDEKKIIDMELNGFFLLTSDALQGFVRNVSKLIKNKNNNIAESFMGVMARFNMGKRVNLTQGWSYQMRATLSVCRFNEGPSWHREPYKMELGIFPGQNFSRFINNRCLIKETSTLWQNNHSTDGSRSKQTTYENCDYGPKATKAPLTLEEEASERNRILNNLNICLQDNEVHGENSEEGGEKNEEEMIALISIQTIGQFDNDAYRIYRQNRLTASNFGCVIKRLPHTSFKGNIKKILYSNFMGNESTNYGNIMEDAVRRRFQEETGIIVEQTGLHICRNRNYLAASPDGLLGEQGIIEIKCLKSLIDKKMTIEEAINDKIMKNRICLTKNKDNQIILKQNHDYYYQVQGQLNIAERNFCYFVVFYGHEHPLFLQKIYRDDDLWNNKMVPILDNFYMEGILKELVKRDIQNGRDWVDPRCILEAQQKKILRKRKNDN